MAFLQLTDAAKDAYLGGLLGTVDPLNYAFRLSTIKLLDEEDGVLFNGPLAWNDPSGGISSISTASITPSASGYVYSAELYSQSGYLIAFITEIDDGTVIALDDYDLTAGVPVGISGTFKVFPSLGDQQVFGKCNLSAGLQQAMAEMILKNTARPAMFAYSWINGTAGYQYGVLKFYSGPQPATADTPISGSNTLLLTAQSAYHYSYFNLLNGIALPPYPQINLGYASATGTASFCRVTKGDSGVTSLAMDFSVGGAGSGAGLIVTSTSFVNASFAYLTNETSLVFPAG